jgi:hypothetical protein
MRHKPKSRHGSILVLVAGMSALLLALAVSVLASSRALNEPSVIVLQEAQNRITLGGALQFIQETSRMGWGNTPADQAFGWTDVRDGDIGPRGPRSAGGTISRLGWTPGGNFPAPGGVYRGDMFAWRLPPYAISLNATPNPFQLTASDQDQATWAPIVGASPVIREWNDGSPTRSASAEPFWLRAVTEARTNGTPYISQPVKNTWAEFAAGDKLPLPESVGRAWFRIYRETSSDCNGDGSPWYDTVPFAGSGTFIVTVGAGGTRGYRFWDSTTDFLNGRTSLPASSSSYSTPMDPVTAQSAGEFVTSDQFRFLRQSERIAWYRVQWTANSSAGLDPTIVQSAVRDPGGNNQYQGILAQTERSNDLNTIPRFGGSIRWIQRLEQEPPVW